MTHPLELLTKVATAGGGVNTMNKRELDLLEKVFAAEIDGAMKGYLGIHQTKSKLAEKLWKEGYLIKRTTKLKGWPPVTIEGYRLSLLGNATYCTSERCA